MNKNIVIGLLALISFLISIGLVVDRLQTKRQVFVQLQKVFAGFEMSKEYNKKLEAIKYQRKAIVDSIELQVNAMARRIEAGNKDKEMLNQYMDAKESYFKTRQNFEADNQQILTQYNSEIFKQLSQYTTDFGKEKGYDFILGAEGSGVVMYAKEKTDVSEDLINYINDKYHGKK